MSCKRCVHLLSDAKDRDSKLNPRLVIKTPQNKYILNESFSMGHMHDLSTFGDHLDGHSEIWEFTKGGKGRESKMVMTADKAGDIWYHTSIGEHENGAWLDKSLGGSFQEATMDNYAKRLSEHLGFEPTVSAVKGNRRTLSFKLPKDAVRMSPEKLAEFLETGNAYNLDCLTDEGYEWLNKEKRLIYSRFPFEQLGAARIDTIQQMPPASLLDVVKREEMIFPQGGGASRAKTLIDHIQANPDFIKDLEARLEKAGIEPKFQIAGSGATGTFLKAGDVVVAIRGDILRDPASVYTNKPQVTRQPIPQHIHPLDHYQHSNLDVEILPRLETDGIHYSAGAPLREAITATPHPDAEKYWCFTDSEGRNIGQSAQGTNYVIDGDAVMAFEKKAGGNYGSRGAVNWVNEHGVWKQYEEFQPLHEKFNSPLHQQGGKLGIAAKVEETVQEATAKIETIVTPSSAASHSGGKGFIKAAEEVAEKGSGKTKWIIGGVVAGTAAIGTAIALTRKSHIQRQQERKQTASTQQQSL